MPFVSKKQNAWAHTDAGQEALGGPSAVKEWESDTNYETLPDQAPKKKKFNYVPQRVRAGYTKEQRVA